VQTSIHEFWYGDSVAGNDAFVNRYTQLYNAGAEKEKVDAPLHRFFLERGKLKCFKIPAYLYWQL